MSSPGSDGRYDAGDVVAEETEARVFRLALHQSAQSGLRGARHRVRLVQDHQLEARHSTTTSYRMRMGQFIEKG